DTDTARAELSRDIKRSAYFEFLKDTDRTSITNRLELREIYNIEFRQRNAGIKHANFSSVLYALKRSQRITRRGDRIYFNSMVCTCTWSVKYQCNGNHTHRSHKSVSLCHDTFKKPNSGSGLTICSLCTCRAQLISDKCGISITSDSPFNNGKLQLCREDTYEVKLLDVKNTGTQPVHFTYYTPLHWLTYLTLKDEHKVTKTNPLALQPGNENITSRFVHFKCSFVGFYPATLAFEFKPDLQASTKFHIVRFIEATCVTALGLELKPEKPFRPCFILPSVPVDLFTVVDGQKPDGLSLNRLQVVVGLPMHKIPPYIDQLINSLKRSAPFQDKRELLESPLSWERYAEKFQLLLYLEERQMEVDIRRYNIPNSEREYAIMQKDRNNKRLLIMEVPGVSENRPSVLRGDQLLVYPAGERSVKYCGYVHSVQLDQVKLGFSSKLLDRFVDKMKFHVEFTFNRLTLQLQHRAAKLAGDHGLEKVLFPAAPALPQPELPNLRLFDSKLEKNPEQYQAVQHIVAGSSRPAPYVVFGPPGTGKTVTLVEAIKQIEKTKPLCHILACAPSNSATDLLCTKILDHVDERKVHRMYATSRDPHCVPERLKACSNLVGDSYVFGPKEELMEYKIIVTTLFTTGRLVTGGIPAGHFTHIFVDEAGHATETECLIPLAGLLNADSGQVVLAGDPKQLGPILRSPFALRYGMGVSLLERMMNNFSLYQKNNGVFDNRFVTKLLRNYRSHPAILKVPNELFYDGELQVCADEILRNSYCRWEYLPKMNFPVIFHSVTGVDEREASSPSFFNVTEVEVLMDYVKKLLQTQGKKGLATISPKDIGIIAPYRKQVQKIRKALEKVGKDLKCLTGVHLCQVGSVEEFQGQERRVILVSTVRSSPDYLEIDKEFNLGFVKNEKRFNVALTRAQALLIVVGNPRVLESDSTWKQYVTHILISILLKINIFSWFKKKNYPSTAESVVQQLLDPEWRNDL
uniref:RNA helicase n=1 Tax=Mastacembelus armatus TaxID=205130 RepID=A0A7N8WQ20_9TELE